MEASQLCKNEIQIQPLKAFPFHCPFSYMVTALRVSFQDAAGAFTINDSFQQQQKKRVYAGYCHLASDPKWVVVIRFKFNF